MAKHHLRHDTTCQNCGQQVLTRFCGNCGQENTETRQSFGHLLRHFVEDLTHYDTAFWLTIRYLLFRPAYLTIEFLKGRRNSFVPPVRLYIFISFITFLLPYVLPDIPGEADKEHVEQAMTLHRDSVDHRVNNYLSLELVDGSVVIPNRYKTMHELDSVQNSLPAGQRMDAVDYWFAKRYVAMQKYNKYELGEKFFESFGHNFPKALFVYMPLFALVLWLFHSKKRWLYFDHAIFTLHYFSFLLLVFNIMSLSEELFFIGESLQLTVQAILLVILILAIFVYFFVAHRRMYRQHWFVSGISAIFIYGINLVLFLGVLAGLAFISLMTIH